MKLTFVCTGNICRSPMAEYLLKNKLGQDDKNHLEVDSAGVSATAGRPASQPAVEALKEIGIADIEMHKAQPVSDVNFEEGDQILTMTRAHLSLLPGELSEQGVQTGLFKEYVGRNGGVSDPYGAGIETYRELRDDMIPVINELLEKLEEKGLVAPENTS